MPAWAALTSAVNAIRPGGCHSRSITVAPSPAATGMGAIEVEHMAGINAAPTCLIFRRDNNMRGVRGIDIGLTQGVRRSVDKSNARTCFDSKQDNQRCQRRRPG